MKILLQGRLDLLSRYGGDTYLIKSLQKGLLKSGIHSDVSTYSENTLPEFDIIHFFGIMRIHDLYPYFLQAKKYHKKIIVTPIYENLNLLDKYGRVGWEGFFANILSNDLKELGKGLLRAVKDKKQLKSAFLQFLAPYSKQQKDILSSADSIFVTSYGEMNDLRKKFAIPKSRFSIVPICIDKENSQAGEDLFVRKYGLRNFVVSVGRIEPKKNQLNILKAIKDTEIEILFIGSTSLYHMSYVNDFLKQLRNTPNAKYLGYLDRKMLLSAYAAANVHVLASWFEVIGVVNLEAAINGCNIVTTANGYTKEYLGNLAWYCDPAKVDSIKTAIIKAYNSTRRNNLKNLILERYTWDKIIPKIIEVYKDVLKK